MFKLWTEISYLERQLWPTLQNLSTKNIMSDVCRIEKNIPLIALWKTSLE